MSKVTVNGIDLELNLLDADVMEMYEKANGELQAKISNPANYEGKSSADGMRFQCRCIEEFIDNLFGAGTSARLLAGFTKNDLGARIECCGQVLKIGEQARIDTKQIAGKYVPMALNREQRREAQRDQAYNGKKNKGNKYRYGSK